MKAKVSEAGVKTESFTVIIRMGDGSYFEMNSDIAQGDEITISSSTTEVMRGGGFGYLASPPRLKMDVSIENGTFVRPGKRHARKKTSSRRRR